MSRVARIPVSLTKGVEARSPPADHGQGTAGHAQARTEWQVRVTVADGKISFVAADPSREAKAMSGTLRALVAGMVEVSAVDSSDV